MEIPTQGCTNAYVTVLAGDGLGVFRVDLFPNGVEAAHVHDATTPQGHEVTTK